MELGLNDKSACIPASTSGLGLACATALATEEARAAQVKSIAAGRLGRPEEYGAACAFRCSTWAGYNSGQNPGFDGGSSPAFLQVQTYQP